MILTQKGFRIFALLLFFLLPAAVTCFAQYTEVQKQIEVKGGILKGTLMVPDSVTTYPLVIIQAGSGPTDKNGNNPFGVRADSYLMLAKDFAAHNIATLLIDKRGVASSAPAGTDEAGMLFTDYADDLVAWTKMMKKDKNIKHVFLAGHSEGSLVAMIAGSRTKVKGVISIAGAGRHIDQVISWQLQQQMPAMVPVFDSLANRLLQHQSIQTVPPALYSLLRPSIQNYMASWMQFNPCFQIKKLKCPVMIVQGSTDLQVEVSESTILHECAPGATYVLIDGMNHVLKTAPLNRKDNMATYRDPSLPLAPGFSAAMISFIKKAAKK